MLDKLSDDQIRNLFTLIVKKTKSFHQCSTILLYNIQIGDIQKGVMTEKITIFFPDYKWAYISKNNYAIYVRFSTDTSSLYYYPNEFKTLFLDHVR